MSGNNLYIEDAWDAYKMEFRTILKLSGLVTAILVAFLALLWVGISSQWGIVELATLAAIAGIVLVVSVSAAQIYVYEDLMGEEKDLGTTVTRALVSIVAQIIYVIAMLAIPVLLITFGALAGTHNMVLGVILIMIGLVAMVGIVLVYGVKLMYAPYLAATGAGVSEILTKTYRAKFSTAIKAALGAIIAKIVADIVVTIVLLPLAIIKDITRPTVDINTTGYAAVVNALQQTVLSPWSIIYNILAVFANLAVSLPITWMFPFVSAEDAWDSEA